MINTRNAGLGAWLGGAALLFSAYPAAADRLFVSDFTLGEIYRVDLPGTVPVLIATVPGSPEDGDCSPSGLIYFAESLDDRVSRWDQSGGNATDIIPAAGFVSGPEGLTFDLAGNLYMNTRSFLVGTDGAWRLQGGDPINPVTQILTPFTDFGEGSVIPLAGPHTGSLVLVARGETQVLLSEPIGAAPTTLIPLSAFPPDVILYGVVTNGCGELFVSYRDSSNFGLSGIKRFSPTGAFIDDYVSGLDGITFMDFDSAGNLFFADSLAGNVWRVAPDKTRTFVFAGFEPHGIAICRDKRVPDCAGAVTCSAGGPYQKECAGPTTCLALDASGSTGTSLSYSWTTNCPGASFSDPKAVKPTLCVASAGCVVDCQVNLTVSSGSASATCSAPVHIEDTLAPVLQGVPPDVTVECDKVPPPPVVVAKDLCDPDVPVAFKETRIDGKCPGDYRLEREWRAIDDCGHPVADDQTVTVVDTTPPEITPGSDNLFCLWPPNHWYVCFTDQDILPEVKDNCSEPVTWVFSGCASDQPDDARESDPTSPWNGDGHTTEDCVVLADGKGLCVRAERAGTGPTAQSGRHYGIAMIARDACGNESKPVVVGNIYVPHDQSPAEKSCIDSTHRGCRPNQSIPCSGK